MTTKYGVQDRKTGLLFAGLVGTRDVRWTLDRGERYELSKGQAQKVVDKLKREKQDCEPVVITLV